MDTELNKEFGKKIASEAASAFTIHNTSLKCKDCVFRFNDTHPELVGQADANGRMYGKTTTCSKYDIKPNNVLLGKNCKLYKKES